MARIVIFETVAHTDGLDVVGIVPVLSPLFLVAVVLEMRHSWEQKYERY